MSGGVENNIDNVVPTPVEKTEVNLAPEAPSTPTTSAEPTNDRDLLAWSAPTFDYFEKNIWWYVIAAVVVLAIVGYFVWVRDWFSLGITVVVSAVLFWYVATNRPIEGNFAITTFGIRAQDRYIPFSDIHSFSLLYTPKIKKVYFVFLKKYLPTLAIDITNVDPSKVRIVLSRKIPETPIANENILDRLTRFLKI